MQKDFAKNMFGLFSILVLWDAQKPNQVLNSSRDIRKANRSCLIKRGERVWRVLMMFFL